MGRSYAGSLLGVYDVAVVAPWLLPLISLAGVVLLFTMHLARGIGKLHGSLAKHLLVRNAKGPTMRATNSRRVGRSPRDNK